MVPCTELRIRFGLPQVRRRTAELWTWQPCGTHEMRCWYKPPFRPQYARSRAIAVAHEHAGVPFPDWRKGTVQRSHFHDCVTAIGASD